MEVKLDDLKEMPFEPHEEDKFAIRDGDVLICEGGEAGRAAIWNGPDLGIKFQKAIHRVRCGADLYNRYLVHKLMYDYHNGQLADYLTGVTIKHITGQDLARYQIPLPPLAEQMRIVAILDEAAALRRNRQEALLALSRLLKATFSSIFGDPAVNERRWDRMTLRSVSTVFSDGPFGSNLKSEHYTETGIRVIRLQNIGSGEFLDEDRAFVTEDHFARLRKHSCLPGDLLIGTLGDPNLRACIQPDDIPVALNKADCVQMRCDQDIAVPEYIEALLNHPSTERLAQNKVQGQTRLRISMGRLRELEVPMPPVDIQRAFSARVRAIRDVQRGQREHLAQLDALFASLQHRAFRGEL